MSVSKRKSNAFASDLRVAISHLGASLQARPSGRSKLRGHLTHHRDCWRSLVREIPQSAPGGTGIEFEILTSVAGFVERNTDAAEFDEEVVRSFIKCGHSVLDEISGGSC